MTACKIQIQLFSSQHVTSNDVIQGCVLLDISRDIFVRAIAIKLEGVASTFVTLGPYSSHTQKYKELYQKFELLEIQQEPMTFKKGQYMYPFEFTVPEQLPPSFTHSFSNRIDYFLKATVSRPGISCNYRTILALYHTPSVPYRNEDWSFETKVVHVLIDPKQVSAPYKSLDIKAINSHLLQSAPGPPQQAVVQITNNKLLCDALDTSPPVTEISNGDKIERPRWGFLHKWRGRKAFNLQVDAWFMPEGLVVGEQLPLKLFIHVREAMVLLQLSMLRVAFEVKTEFRAEGQSHKDTRELEILKLDETVKLASSPIIDISHLLRDLRVPADFTPSFRGHTMRRSYRLKLSMRVNSSISRTTAMFRNEVKIYSNVETEALPLYEPRCQMSLPMYDSVAV
ncbi:hypothetical protein B9G98_02403 [Wickerhamiella sorbophila]|uniref:Arrestin-like N-terminal domain-containing protein n=1 Tax=Wickerhamiella sorbophila TaxID=45607 RepID=A0A2T0FIF8_9ASCO|nr:hypothetical protein B9G98_02403 [Wickerhamiella sorbophila]PRT54783.1 hypothetical protein B9G98_02403 [Wickerhamiella sorbophila]